jgi:hypothetical protein
MNLHDAFVLSLALVGKKGQSCVLMPDTLYGSQGKRLAVPKGLIPWFLRFFQIGDALVLSYADYGSLLRKLIRDEGDSLFKIEEKQFAPESFPFVETVELEDALQAISAFPSRKDKGLYECFMEMCIIMLLMESLKNSKIMLGGVWISRSSNHAGKQLNGYEMYVKVLSEKNEAIERVKAALVNYPPYSFEEIGLLNLKGPRRNISPYGRYLENLYLQIFLKNEIQRLYLMTQYITAGEREMQMQKIEEVRSIIALYKSTPRSDS